LSFLSFLVILGLNLSIYFWISGRRNTSVEDLRKAIARMTLLSTVRGELQDVRKQIALLSEVTGADKAGGAGSEDVAAFGRRLQTVDREIEEIEQLTDPGVLSQVKLFRQAVQELSLSWRTFYENLGVNQPKAIMELAMRGEPASKKVLDELLPQLEQGEKTRMEAARVNFNQVARFTDRIMVVIFLISIVVVLGVVYRLSSYLTAAVGELQIGALYIGNGILNHRIPVTGHDELADVARAYNEMAESLHQARKELTHANFELEQRHHELEKQRSRAESLLLNILPRRVAEELQAKGSVDPKYFEDVTIIFTDFVGFTNATENLAAEDLVHMLHDYFTAFDHIVERYYLEKLKTIGDSYMCASGLPLGARSRRTPSHPVDAVMAALEMLKVVEERDRPDAEVRLAVRIGIHSGPVVAGVVGIQKFAFDIWGDTVNFASRMESSGAASCINISGPTHTRVKDFFACESRGKIMTKDKREVDMYFVNGVQPSLMVDQTEIPPPAFVRRYHVYFQKDPPAFPAFLMSKPADLTKTVGIS
jgi:class 3 adenylate cyclase/HAMP domain-containing protein